jgi:hypothetical protein
LIPQVVGSDPTILTALLLYVYNPIYAIIIQCV